MRRTVLHEVHRTLGARLVPFAGFEMPLVYTGIREEHQAVREAAGLFDLGHMGRLVLRGRDRIQLLDWVATNRYQGLEPGHAHYALLCQPDGGVIDDIIAYVLPEECLVVVNAANHQTVLAWIEQQRMARGLQAELLDRSEQLAMLALQGPRALAILGGLTGLDLAAIPYYGIAEGELAGVRMLLARTGYTGEDGFELYLPAEHAVRIWQVLLEQGRPCGLLPCGLGARDTLRLEAAMPLYGHELSRQINPYEAGLGFAVRLDKEAFVGREALARIKEQGPRRRLACITCEGRRIPRQDHPVLAGGRRVGTVTSGTFSPTLERPICMALLEPACAVPGTEVAIEVRGQLLPGRVGKRPFYKRERTP
ncbi:MAG: aminomethyltransferase [Planctomycetota bacterium]|nr:MAG: aminomethyltransferase [Planctomycetota bacterium]